MTVVADESTERVLCTEEEEEDGEGTGAEAIEADVEGVLTWDVPEEAADSEGVGVWVAVTVAVAGSCVCTLVCTTV